MFDTDQHETIQGHQQFASVKRLTHRLRLADNKHVPEKEGAGFSSLKTQERTDGAMPFFYVCMSSCASYERRWRGSLRTCWFSFFHQSANPAICRSPRLAVGRGPTEKEDHTMHQHASTTPKQLPIDYDLADSLGMDRAQDWNDRAPGDIIPPASAAAWRAICYAHFVHDYQDHEKFLGLLKAWTEGFDRTLTMANPQPATQARPDVIAAWLASGSGYQPAPKAAHEPHSWLNGDAKYDPAARLAALTMDVCDGIETCLGLVHSSDIQRQMNTDADAGQEVPPTLNTNDTERLLRLAMVTVRMLASASEKTIDRANKHAAGEGK